MDQKTDAEIVARVLKGDKQAYALLVDAYKGPVFNLTYRMTGNQEDAEDLTQEIFIRAYQKLCQFDQNKKYFTWLYTIAINLIRNHLKKKSKEIKNHTKDRFYSESNNQGPDIKEVDLFSENIMKGLDEIMRKLSVQLRETIVLKFYQDLTFEEIANITGDSVSTVKMRLYRGLEKLKSMMDKQK